MYSNSLMRLLDCAKDFDTRDRISNWIKTFVTRYGQDILVSNSEIKHVGEGPMFDKFMTYRRNQAFHNIGLQIKDQSQIEESEVANGRRERISVLVIKP